MGMPTEKLSVKNLISIFNNDIVITPNAQMMIISKNTLKILYNIYCFLPLYLKITNIL